MQNISLITNKLYIKNITPSIGYCEFYVQLIKKDIDIEREYTLSHKKQMLIDMYNELKNINGENMSDLTNNNNNNNNNNNIINDLYIQESPNEENKINIFKNEWVSSLPQFEDISGNINLFGDERIHWLMSRIKVFNKNILELGPLEGGHSYMLEKIGGAQVISIEQNQKNFIKCLIVKNIYNLNTKYIFGDFNKFFINNKNFFDMILASGVLYHQIKPISLLQNISKVTKNVFIWTHYFDSIRDDISYQFDGEIEHDFLGEKFVLYKHNYGITNNPTFCGGSLPFSMWMKRDDIINVLELLEFKNIEIAFDDKQHPSGSAFALFATKK